MQEFSPKKWPPRLFNKGEQVLFNKGEEDLEVMAMLSLRYLLSIHLGKKWRVWERVLGLT